MMSPNEKRVLEGIYRTDPRPSKATLGLMARELRTPVGSLNMWFRQRRVRAKRARRRLYGIAVLSVVALALALFLLLSRWLWGPTYFFKKPRKHGRGKTMFKWSARNGGEVSNLRRHI